MNIKDQTVEFTYYDEKVYAAQRGVHRRTRQTLGKVGVQAHQDHSANQPGSTLRSELWGTQASSEARTGRSSVGRGTGMIQTEGMVQGPFWRWRGQDCHSGVDTLSVCGDIFRHIQELIRVETNSGGKDQQYAPKDLGR
ncbi:hypothetical protein DSO57_1036183 [Entomophthora muscae]|uniref:Uncharacterized protein n=1 Tax=Entomophthora muscae TaxID=34485 RepID=A0ACC2TXL6_9FUNG|nr:hypothetical protein DSO57_1036183 [Entomophthora muscae]